MNRKELEILRILDGARNPMRGLGVVEASNGVLGRGVVYVHLGRLEDKGLVSSEEEEVPTVPDMPLRLYAITPGGRRARSKAMSREGDLPSGLALA